jgi:hypothetical protein
MRWSVTVLRRARERQAAREIRVFPKPRFLRSAAPSPLIKPLGSGDYKTNPPTSLLVLDPHLFSFLFESIGAHEVPLSLPPITSLPSTHPDEDSASPPPLQPVLLLAGFSLLPFRAGPPSLELPYSTGHRRKVKHRITVHLLGLDRYMIDRVLVFDLLFFLPIV